MLIIDENVRRQATHFDEKTPISPWPQVLRKTGFHYHYIAKDLLIKKSLEKLTIKNGSRVLDIGCGIGVWLDRLGSSYGTIGTGIDISQRSLSLADSFKVNQNSFVLADARALPFADNSYDLVTSLDVLEHINEPEKSLDEMIRVACDNGHVMIYAVSKRNTFTYQWFERKLLSVIRFDPYQLSCHDPQLLIDPDLIRDRLDNEEVSLERLEFFHAFFTSLFDRILLVMYLICMKIGLFEIQTTFHRRLGIAILTVASLISRIALNAILWLDKPWLQRGYANGFLAVARKLITRIPVDEVLRSTDCREKLLP